MFMIDAATQNAYSLTCMKLNEKQEKYDKTRFKIKCQEEIAINLIKLNAIDRYEIASKKSFSGYHNSFKEAIDFLFDKVG